MSDYNMTSQELRTVAILASIFVLRMLGLCMLLPVFAVEAMHYVDATQYSIGLAVGVYGLLQAVLQVPFGMLSDRFGRKRMIALGLAFIMLGSVISAQATTIYGLIFGRALQGCGAIGSVVIATLADHTREQVRSSAMAILGASIGVAFSVAMVLGPWLNAAFGLSSIFSVTGILALCCMLLLLVIPQCETAQEISIPQIPTSMQLINLNMGAFVLHASLAALFLVLPLMLQQQGLEIPIWAVYGGVLLIAMPIAWQVIQNAERKDGVETLQLLAICGLLLGPLLLYIVNSWLSICGCLVLYFTVFCILEASLPTLVARYATTTKRGVALGMYATLQFMGVFFGGMIGGWLHGRFGTMAVVGFCIGLVAVWLGFSVYIKNRARYYEMDSGQSKI